MTNSKSSKDEFAFIGEITKLFSTYRENHIKVPNGDDAAIYTPNQAAKGQVICVDTMVEGVHFTKKTMTPFDIGYKSLAINLSDIAAMGATPAYFLVSIAIPKDWQEEELIQIFEGMSSLAEAYQIDLLGGDTVSTLDHLVITITVIGEIDEAKQLRRSHAKPGHLVFITGQIGSSAAGLHYLLHHQDRKEMEIEAILPLIDRHQRPEPHLQQGQIIAELSTASPISLNDISDGLASEANEIATSSQATLVIEKEKIPIPETLSSYAMKLNQDPYHWIFNGGEDFVLIGTCSKELAPILEQRFKDEALELFFIGYVEEGQGEVFLMQNDQRLPLYKKGYNHFSNR